LANWRFLDTGARIASENIALDSVLLESRSAGTSLDTLRLLRFNPPAVLVGYHQDAEQEVRLAYTAEAGIDVNRRITGGGAIYFDTSSIGWEVIASISSVGNGHLEGLFRLLCSGAVRALEILGIDASYRPRNDIEVRGRKISGTGGTELGDAFLFQGTLLVDFDAEAMIRALRIPVVKLKDKELASVRRRVTCIKKELGYQPSYDSIRAAFRMGFEETLKIELVDGVLNELELVLLKERLLSFASHEWVFLDRRPRNEGVLVHAVDKKPGGLIRISLDLDRTDKIIRNVLITGDFFICPTKAIVELEAILKFTKCEREEIRRAVHDFFDNHDVRMLGIQPDDLVELILEAAERTSYERLGVSSEDVNHLYPVTKKAKFSLDDCDYLLLPYCSKPLSCEYRAREGCAKCGGCSVGEAYELAEEIGLKPVTIHNFEHLMDTLHTIRNNGAKGFIGCCCEAFYCRHRDELESVDIPGMIVDVDDRTCYELGKEEEALKGDFEAQTQLKMELLTKLFRQVRRRAVGCRTTM